MYCFCNQVFDIISLQFFFFSFNYFSTSILDKRKFEMLSWQLAEIGLYLEYNGL